jgi:antitoxin component of MazEF toxin-antitoxin module
MTPEYEFTTTPEERKKVLDDLARCLGVTPAEAMEEFKQAALQRAKELEEN